MIKEIKLEGVDWPFVKIEKGYQENIHAKVFVEGYPN